MVESNPQSIGKTRDARTLLMEFLLLATVFAAVLGLGAAYLLSTPLWALSGFAFGVGIAARGLWNDYPHDDLGLCNVVTLARVALTALLFGALFEAEAVSAWSVFWVAVAAFGLDGLDGYLARQTGLQSGFGARFDMETDAALGAILATWLLLSGTTGVAVLILGCLRYLFVLACWVRPELNAPLPASFRRKMICVVQIGALILMTLPLTPAGLIMPILLIASGMLLYSFFVDIYWLLLRQA